MAQSGYTPIQLYHSATASAAPTAGNLADGELAINTNDGVLYYKDSGGVVRTLASKNAAAGVFTSITDSALTSGRVTYAGTGGLLQDSANLTFNGTTLTATGFAGALNGTVGASTPNTGAFTTLSASSTVSGTGFSTYMASPPAIGSTTENTGAFTTLTASSTIGVGATAAGTTVVIAKSLTGAVTSRFVWATASVLSDVTNNAVGFATNISTQATAFTLGELNHYFASQGVIGAGSAVTNQYGYRVNTTLIGAIANNYGYYGSIASAAGRYNLYMAGTAANWFNGDVLIYGIGGLGYTTGSGGAVTQITSRTTGVTLNKTNGAITLVSAAGSATYQSFTVTNSTVAATDTIIINQKSGTDLYEISITAVAAGSFRVTYRTTGGTTTEQPVFNFSVIKAVTA